MKILLLSIFTFVSFSAWSGSVGLEVVDEGQSLKVTIDSVSKKIKLVVPEGTELEDKPIHYGTSDFFIVVLQYSNFDSGTSVIYAINKKGEKLWSKDLQAFNPSPPLIEKNYVYMSAIGRVWKLKKANGKTVWEHGDLYKRKKFNGAEAVARKGSKIVFSSNLQVDDKTGAITDVTK